MLDVEVFAKGLALRETKNLFGTDTICDTLTIGLNRDIDPLVVEEVLNLSHDSSVLELACGPYISRVRGSDVDYE